MVWFVFAMSEHGDYSLDVPIRWTGVDTNSLIVTQADTVLPLVITSNCFNAIDRYLTVRKKAFIISISSDTVVKVGKPLFDDLCRQLGFSGVHDIASPVETLTFATTERRRRAYVPQLRDVDFIFAGQVGLSGSPTLQPDTVWLYGDPRSLQRIPELYTAPAAVANITDSGYYMLALEPIWEKYNDVRPSTDSVRIFIPAERQVETTVSVPVKFMSEYAHQQVRLYPDHVNVTLWVPVHDYELVSESHFEAVVRYDGVSPTTDLPVLITRFPAQSRIKSVNPSTISFVIIK